MDKTELNKLAGRIVRWRVTAQTAVDCRVTETRQLCGRDEIHLTPLAGTGSAWVTLGKVELLPEVAA